MKNGEILQVLEHNLFSLKSNIKELLGRKHWTDQTETILLEFRREADALNEENTGDQGDVGAAQADGVAGSAPFI